VVQYSAGLLASIFAAYDLSWLIPVIPLLSFANQVLASFCASDPPAVVALTAQEAGALLNLTFGTDFDSGLTKVTNLYLNVIWHDACQCDSGSATAFAPPAPPAGTPIFQPPVAPLAAPCVAVGPQQLSLLNPGTVSGTIANFSGKNVTWAVSKITMTGILAGKTVVFTLSIQDTSFSLHTVSTRTFTSADNGVAIVLSAAGPTSPQLATRSYVLNATNSPALLITEEFDFFCDGALPTDTQNPCCPPDVATQAYLDVITRQLNLIQRQLVPFAYIATTAHTGLSGAGSFAIQGLLGVKVNVTTLPGQIGQEGTSPAEYFDMGFLTFGTPDGYDHSVRLERSQQIVLPARCSAFTSFAYDLHPGVVCTITELVREP